MLNLKSVQARIKEQERSGDKSEEAVEELGVLRQYRTLAEKVAMLKTKLQDAEGKLEAIVFAKYDDLVEEEIKSIVVDEKWMVALATAVRAELNRVSQVLTGRIKELADRYTMPLATISDEVKAFGSRVDVHLHMMGFTW